MDPPPRPKNRPQTLKPSESTEFDFGIESSKDAEESPAPPPKPAHRPGRKIGILPAEPEEPQFRTATDLQARLESLDTQGAASNPEAIALFKETADKLDAEGPGGPTSRALHYPFLGPGVQKVSPEEVREKPIARPKLEPEETYELEIEDAETELADAKEEMRLKSELETPNAQSRSEPQIDSEAPEAPASEYTKLAQEIEEAREEFNECKKEKELRDSLEPEEDVFDVKKELAEDPKDAEVIHKEYKEGLDAETVEEIRKAEEVRLAKEEHAREKWIKREVVDAPPMDVVAEHDAAVRKQVQKELPINEDLDLTVIPEVDETSQKDALSGAASEPVEPTKPTVTGETLEKPLVEETPHEEVSSDRIAPPKPSKRPTKSEEKKIPESEAIGEKTEEGKPEAEASGPPPKPTKRPSKPVSDDELIAHPKSLERPSEDASLDSSEPTPEETPEKESAQKIEKVPSEEPSKASLKSQDSGKAGAKTPDEEDTKTHRSVSTDATSEPARSLDKEGTESAFSESLGSSSDTTPKTAPPKPAKRPTRTNTESSDVTSPVTDTKDGDTHKDLPPKPAKPARRPTEELKVKPKPPKPKSALASRFEAVLKEQDAPKPKPVLKPKPKPASSGFSARFADLNAALSRPPSFKESKEATETQEAASLDEQVNKSVDTNESADAQLKAMPRNPRARGPKLGAKRRLPSSVTAPKTTLAIVVGSAPVWEIAGLEDDSDTGPLTIVAPAHTAARRSEPEIDAQTKLELESAIRHSIDPKQVAISDLQLPSETVGPLASAEPKDADIPVLSSLLDHVPDTTLDPEEESFNPPKLSLSFDDLVAEGEPSKSAQGTPSLGVNLSKYLDKSPQSADMRPEDQEYFEIPIKKKSEATKQITETEEPNPEESNPEESKSEESKSEVNELEPGTAESEPESGLKSEEVVSEKVNVGEGTIEEKAGIEEQSINRTETETENEADIQI